MASPIRQYPWRGNIIDQLLVCGEKWFDKPTNLGQARAQLQAQPSSLISTSARTT
jgi:hypothetical protein